MRLRGSLGIPRGWGKRREGHGPTRTTLPPCCVPNGAGEEGKTRAREPRHRRRSAVVTIQKQKSTERPLGGAHGEPLIRISNNDLSFLFCCVRGRRRRVTHANVGHAKGRRKD